MATLSKNMIAALNKQIGAELYSAYLYYAIQAYFEYSVLYGFAHWMKVQAGEELNHANKLADYLIDCGVLPTFPAIDKPNITIKTAQDAFDAALKHERKISDLINDLVNLAIKEGDHATHTMLLWFVNEQIEEEANSYDNAQKIERIGSDVSALLIFDAELGKRGVKA